MLKFIALFGVLIPISAHASLNADQILNKSFSSSSSSLKMSVVENSELTLVRSVGNTYSTSSSSHTGDWELADKYVSLLIQLNLAFVTGGPGDPGGWTFVLQWSNDGINAVDGLGVTLGDSPIDASFFAQYHQPRKAKYYRTSLNLNPAGETYTFSVITDQDKRRVAP